MNSEDIENFMMWKVVPCRDKREIWFTLESPPWGVASVFSVEDYRKFSLVVKNQDEVQKKIKEEFYSKATVSEIIGHAEGQEKLIGLLEDKPPPTDGDLNFEDDAPVIRIINTFIANALLKESSDIHFEPYEKDSIVRFRIDGVLQDVARPMRALYSALVSRIKIMAHLDIAERRLPQDGRMKIRLNDREVDIRVSTLPTGSGERVVMRLLDKRNLGMKLDDLGMSQEIKNKFVNCIDKPNGIILVTGPTGSGKTTTLYASLEKLNAQDRNIMTVEDPIEYDIKGISQTQVLPRIGLDFSNVLRAILRQDPDVIMIGEIRDTETARIAVQASLTGHLVLATLHTNDAASAVVRLRDMGIEPYLISSTLNAVLAQRLVRKLCKNGNSYKGRTGIYELLEINDTVRELIKKNTDNNVLRRKAITLGMKTLIDDGNRLVDLSITDEEEVARVTLLTEDEN